MLFPILSIFLGLVAAVPQFNDFRPRRFMIHSISLIGSGCPEGSAHVQVDSTGTIFEASFSRYQIQSGPDVYASELRKNCKLSLNMDYDPGYQFRLMGTDMSGFASIPHNVGGQCVNTFSFAGNGDSRIDYTVTFFGKLHGTFDLRSSPGLSSWSSCGRSSSILNLNTACELEDTNQRALIAVDEVSGKLTVKCALQWRRC
ncbi:hypothetical protein XA68_15493 [Ophiocordyceps unilateralis]|uniref:Secreted protein n=1 Tax=Ophiocordyceps unilateralis TaxID=268505 RepID=A0A2A9P723_OPHUN|nr:hypothetical protein XA68_15493 [Ophiocordyceps unilateralis]